MKNKIGRGKVLLLLLLLLSFPIVSFAEKTTENDPSADTDTIPAVASGYIHQIGIEYRPEHIIQTHDFLKGDNYFLRPIDLSESVHLKYSFQSQLNSCSDRIYGGAYQGIGLAYFRFHDPEEVGDPFAFYLFQGARIARLAPRLSLNYEWNFGISVGWEPYDYLYNHHNKIIGSEVNAYLNADFYLNWTISPQMDLNVGAALTHFSNGNTEVPNAGLNTVGAKLGLVYNINRQTERRSALQAPIPEFQRHISYDLTFFGSWRRKGVPTGYGDELVASPKAYTVLGFNFAPMYNLGYKLRMGVSLDGIYDGSANAYLTEEQTGTEDDFLTPPAYKQLSLGLSGRAEYVMPFFTVGIGIGANILHSGGDMKYCYQVVSLKTELTRNSFLHIGYSLSNFKDPNFLMLGIGFRFHNLYPHLKR